MRVTGCRIMVRVTGCRIMVEELKSSTTTTPAATLSRCRRVPCIVNVLPVPVCPYAKTQAQSSTTLTRRRLKEALANAVTQQEDAKPKHVGQRGAVREHAEQEAADHEFVGRRGVERLRVDHGANGGRHRVTAAYDGRRLHRAYGGSACCPRRGRAQPTQLPCRIGKRRACLNSNHDYHPPLIAIPISDLFHIRVSCQIGGY